MCEYRSLKGVGRFVIMVLLACLFACLFACLLACLFVCLFVCLFACLFACLLVSLCFVFVCVIRVAVDTANLHTNHCDYLGLCLCGCGF